MKKCNCSAALGSSRKDKIKKQTKALWQAKVGKAKAAKTSKKQLDNRWEKITTSMVQICDVYFYIVVSH